MSHSLIDCEFSSTEYFDECDLCGELTACVCLASIVSDWAITRLTFPLSFAPSATHAYTFKPKGEGAVEYFGWAESYREAMDAIAHAVNCEKVGA